MMQLANTGVLYLLWGVPLLAFAGHVLHRRRQAGLRRFAHPALHPQPVSRLTRFRWIWQSALALGGLTLTLFALARPQWGVREELVSTRGRDLIVALDVSRSMLARDVFPSRLGRAKVDLLDLVKTLRGDRVGLIAFRGKASLLCPLTTDYGFFTQILDGVGIDSAPAGETNIGDALRKALDAFGADPSAHQAIVLISDGEDLAGGVDAAVEVARKKGIAIFTVGLGDPAGAPVPPSDDRREALQYEGQTVVSRLNHETLRRIAEATGGAYVPIALAHADLGVLYRDHLSRLSALEREESLQRAHIERYPLFLLPAWLCLVAVGLLSQGHRLRRNPLPGPTRLAGRVLTGLALFLTGPTLFAAPPSPPGAAGSAPTPTSTVATVARTVPAGRESARKAQRLYALHQYEPAATLYLEAARGGSAALQAAMVFNAACALYQAGRQEDAAELFQSLYSREKAPLTDAAFNRGVALHQAALQSATNAADSARLPEERRAELLSDSADAFQRALRLQRDSRPARDSLTAVQALLPDAAEQAHIARVLKNEGQTAPATLADRLLKGQRQINAAIPLADTNSVPQRIEALERLAREQKAQTDLLIPLKSQLIQALAQQPADTNRAVRPDEIARYIEATRDRLNQTSRELRDLDPRAAASGRNAETAVYTLWKGIADYPQLLAEDIGRQSNVVSAVSKGLTRASPADFETRLQNQTEAEALTRLFLTRFEERVPPEGIPARQPPPATPTTAQPTPPRTIDTNAPPLLTAEDRRKIVDLAQQAITVQGQAVQAVRNRDESQARQQGQQALTLLKDIEKLLPRESSSTPQPQEKPQPKPSDQKPQSKPDTQPPDPAQPPQPKPEEKPQQPQTPKDIQQLLDLARQREKDYQDAQRRKNTEYPMPPLTRDW